MKLDVSKAWKDLEAPRFKGDRETGFGVVGKWNELPEEVVETMSKGHLDRYMDRGGIGGYQPNKG